jgi:cysteinyl-tRNA synthetase
MLAMDSVLGVLGRNARLDDLAATDLDLVRRVESLMAERAAARAARQWARSDQIRAELSALGIAVSDGPAGATWVRVTNDA